MTCSALNVVRISKARPDINQSRGSAQPAYNWPKMRGFRYKSFLLFLSISAMVVAIGESSNFKLFRDCLASLIIEKRSYEPSRKPKKAQGNGRKSAPESTAPPLSEPNDAEELAEFIDVGLPGSIPIYQQTDTSKYIASESFNSLPSNLRTLTYTAWLNDNAIKAQYTVPLSVQTISTLLNSLPPTVGDSLISYSFLPAHTSLEEFLTPVLHAYLTALAAPPAPPSITRGLATECEICARSWIPLTYHHLIPKDVHVKAVKRGWHHEDQLQNVAWICRACHSFVHRVASNEELAKNWFTVEKLMEREDVRAFEAWVGRIRWKAS